jgi:hypothetical protein
MRLNRGTLIIIVISVVVIVAITLLSSQQASAPGTSGTATATPNAGPVFADLTDTSKIVRFEADNTTDNSRVVMTKDAGGVWTITEATNAQQLATDQTKASTAANTMATLVALDKFPSTSLKDFGLDAPKYTLVLTDSDNKTYTLKIGNQAVANPRYYALVNDDNANVYVLAKDTVDKLTGQITLPAYVASPTPTATATATANPYSEVEQTATQNAIQQQVYSTMTATAQGTYSPTTAPTAETTMEATSEVTAEATTAATAVPTAAPTIAPTEVTPEATTSP